MGVDGKNNGMDFETVVKAYNISIVIVASFMLLARPVVPKASCISKQYHFQDNRETGE